MTGYERSSARTCLLFLQTTTKHCVWSKVTRSTTTSVPRASVLCVCFLCSQSMPTQERKLAYFRYKMYWALLILSSQDKLLLIQKGLFCSLNWSLQNSWWCQTFYWNLLKTEGVANSFEGTAHWINSWTYRKPQTLSSMLHMRDYLRTVVAQTHIQFYNSGNIFWLQSYRQSFLLNTLSKPRALNCCIVLTPPSLVFKYIYAGKTLQISIFADPPNFFKVISPSVFDFSHFKHKL